MSSTKTVDVPITLPTPVLTFLKWLELTQGRDKVYRFVAYFSKFVVQTMKDNGISPDWASRIAKGASSIGTTRKLLRFFRAVEYTNEFLKGFSLKDDFERYATLFKSASLGVWMGADHIQWLNKAGYLKLESTKSIDELHSKAWFWGLLAGVLICLYKLRKVLENYKQTKELLSIAQSSQNGEQVKETNKKLVSLDAERNKQIQGIVKNGVDLVIPCARLGWLPVSDGTVGLAGTVTSVIGIIDTWPKSK